MIRACKGCHFTMSLTESDRGQRFCNHCEELIKTKFCVACANYRGDPAEMDAFEALPVPEFAPYAWMHIQGVWGYSE